MALKNQHSLKRLLCFVGAVAVVLTVLYSDWFLLASSSVTRTPVNWMRNSSSMKSDIEYLAKNKYDPNIENSEAANNLRSLINEELPPESNEAEIRKHIERHFRNPSFEFTGLLNDCWNQDAYGHHSLLSYSDMVSVGYTIRGGKLFYVGISMGMHRIYIDLTEEPVDWYDLPDGNIENPN